jgi:hypothetical protein
MTRVAGHAAAVAVQGLGAAATFASVAVITNLLGLEAQGRYSLLKSWSDTVTTAMLFGLPQVLLHLAYNTDRSFDELRSFAVAYSLAALALCAAAVMVLLAFGKGQLAWVVLAAPLFVFHGLIRPLLLRQFGPVSYAGITVVPAVMLLGLVIVCASTGGTWWGLAILAAGAISAAIAWWAGGFPQPNGLFESLNLMRQTKGVNLHAFVQNLLAAAQFAALLSMGRMLGRDEADVGRLALGLIAVQVSAVAAAFLAPTVYDLFKPGSDVASWLARRWKGALAVGGGVMAATGLAVAEMPALLELTFSVSDSDSVLACRLGVIGGVLLFCSRILMTILQRVGRFSLLSAQSAFRFAGALMTMLLVSSSTNVSIGAAGAGAVLVVEAVCLGWSVISVTRAAALHRNEQ